MAGKVGILVVSYGSRAASMIDAFSRSSNYDVELYIADKQRNPFNIKRAAEHLVIPDLDIRKICDFSSRYKDRIDFGIVGPEGPIINGVRDLVESETGIPVICPTKEFAIEESKVMQRHLLQKCFPDANPLFKVFNKREYSTLDEMKSELWGWLDYLENKVAVKPDRPGYGKGVGVWGDHFNSREELFTHFLSIYENDSVIVEEKIEGEESSFQAFCDGKSLIELPETRDYKRAFDNDEGPNTGGMGSYKDAGDFLPYMTSGDKEREVTIVNKIFRELRDGNENPGLRGIPFYTAFIHSSDGPKILEINSRGGDPEIVSLIPLIKDDFVDVCFDMIHGSLRKIGFEEKASVLTYKVPPNYGGFSSRFPEKVNTGEINTPVDLKGAYELGYGDDLRVYPGSMKLGDDKKTYALGSRTVACVGIAGDIEGAREISLAGVKAITGGALWCRKDIASREHIERSIGNMKRLRD
ncbi:MAG: hypothetical protein U9Q22_07945 [Candidatus Altiarchaeota archaeon]|nr:hypothetical protein [Candidatus Altiarchaeota archaeon]